MDKALEMGKSSAVGSLHLFVGKIVSTVALAVGTIVLALFIQQGDYGLYTIALIPSTTILLFQDWGVSSAMVRFISKSRAEANNATDLRKIVVAGLTFNVLTGVLFTIMSLLLARFVASTIFSTPQASFLIVVSSITILSSSIFGITQSIFVGFEKMKYNSFAMICMALVQGTLAPLLVYFGYGALGAVLGYTLSSVVASILGVGLMYFVIFRKLNHVSTAKFRFFQTLKPLLIYGFSFSLGKYAKWYVGSVLCVYDALLCKRFVSDWKFESCL